MLKKLFSKKYDEFDAMLRAAALILPSLKEGKRIEFYLQDGNVAMVVHAPNNACNRPASAVDMQSESLESAGG